MIDFENVCNGIKSTIVSENTTVDVSTRFIKGKMLMFTKVSIKSFVKSTFSVFQMKKLELPIMKMTLKNVFFTLTWPTQVVV